MKQKMMTILLAPLEHTAVLHKQEFGARVRIAEIHDAGHALLSEQRQAISSAVIRFLSGGK